jgi:hypothetical protein
MPRLWKTGRCPDDLGDLRLARENYDAVIRLEPENSVAL